MQGCEGFNQRLFPTSPDLLDLIDLDQTAITKANIDIENVVIRLYPSSAKDSNGIEGKTADSILIEGVFSDTRLEGV